LAKIKYIVNHSKTKIYYLKDVRLNKVAICVAGGRNHETFVKLIRVFFILDKLVKLSYDKLNYGFCCCYNSNNLIYIHFCDMFIAFAG